MARYSKKINNKHKKFNERKRNKISKPMTSSGYKTSQQGGNKSNNLRVEKCLNDVNHVYILRDRTDDRILCKVRNLTSDKILK